MENNNFLPKFNISKNLANDLRNIEIAKMLSTGWYKGKFDYHMRKAGCVKNINGKEYYTNMIISSDANNFLVKDTVGYHKAEVLRLMGFEDEDLDQLKQTWNTKGVDGIYQRWIAKDEMSKDLFQRYIKQMKEDLKDVTTIEIEYELQAYKKDVYTTDTSRVYNSKQSIFGDRLQWGTSKDNDLSKWKTNNRFYNLDNIIVRDKELSYGNKITFYNGTIDVTDTIPMLLQDAVKSMIAYSGIDFMDRISSEKIGEKEYTFKKLYSYPLEEEIYIVPIGKETFNATIKSSFEEDNNSVHYKRYTAICDQTRIRGSRETKSTNCREEINTEDERIPLNNSIKNYINIPYMAKDFWSYTKYEVGQNDYVIDIFGKKIIRESDKFLFYNSGNNDVGAYIDVHEFKKISIEDVGFYFGNYFDIKVTQKSGGFFTGFIGFVAGILGKIFNVGFNLLNYVPIFRLQLQIMTWIVNKTFGTNMTEKQVFELGLQIALTIIGYLFAPVTMGTSLLIANMALSLSIAGANAQDKQKQMQQESNEKQKLQEERNKQKKEDAKKKEEEQKLKSTLSNNQDEEFIEFLKNPLYKIDREKNEITNSFEKQFKLI